MKEEANRNLLLHHVHVNTFLGICVDAPTPFLAYEYASKGSLRDILLNTNIALDWDFRFSLVTDLARGMEYLHKALKNGVHGQLRDTKCIIDSKWILKVTDYGLQDLHQFESDYRRLSSINSTAGSATGRRFSIFKSFKKEQDALYSSSVNSQEKGSTDSLSEAAGQTKIADVLPENSDSILCSSRSQESLESVDAELDERQVAECEKNAEYRRKLFSMDFGGSGSELTRLQSK